MELEAIPIVDAHCDTILEIRKGGNSLSKQFDKAHLDIQKMKSGGIKIQFFAVFVEPNKDISNALKRSLLLINKFHKEVKFNSSDIKAIENYEDLKKVLHGDKLGALLTVEGGEALEQDLELLELFYHLGVRSIALTWNYRNAIGDGAAEPEENGLSRFGFEVVKKMNEIGILIDVSHLNLEGFWDVIRCSRKPIIASHSNARTICDHPRNLSDEQILAIADNGGVVCVNYVSPFLVKENKATLENVVDHIAYVEKVAGIEHVGIGSDFDGTSELAVGLEDAAQVMEIGKALVSRGYSKHEVQKIMGGNLIKLLKGILK